MQFANAVIMVRPAAFGYNAQTAGTNIFQNKPADAASVQEAAVAEFDAAVEKLRNAGIDVTVWQDTAVPRKPDAVFPNNWISTHPNGKIFLYSMETENRRIERSPALIEYLTTNFWVDEVVDLSASENEMKILEGTGSMILDAENKVAYAAISSRTDKELFEEWCAMNDYLPVAFHATDNDGMAIYHTNVIMCIGDGFVVICFECIRDISERTGVRSRLTEAGYSIVEISMEQVLKFAGNMLQLKGRSGNTVLALSQTAFNSLSQAQRTEVERFTEMLPLDVTTIETVGGGSVRCMLAENFLSKRNEVVGG